MLPHLIPAGIEPKGGIELFSAEADNLRGFAVPSSVQPFSVCVSIYMEPKGGIEPPTHALRMRCSTPELLRQTAPAK